MSSFTDWLITADEDDKREASAFRHHYPVEVEVTELVFSGSGLVDGPTHHEVECGCDDRSGFEYGTEGHDA